MSRQFAADLNIDGAMRARAWEFVTRLMENPAQPGLHIEPIRGARDPRVRTGRVNDNFRAVMFLATAEPDRQLYVLAAIKPHDEANRLAERIIFRANPVNGVLEFDEIELPAPAPAAPVREATAKPGPLNVFTMAELVDQIGIGQAIAVAAREAADTDALLEVAARAPAWQGDALLALAMGRAPSDIVEELRQQQEEADALVEALPVEAKRDPLVIGYAHPATQMDFVRIVDDEQLAQIMRGSFAAWRVFLHPDQRRYAERDVYNGAFRLTGGAGTGKTVVALHRARHLARRDASRRIVLTTYTTTLADNLKSSLRELDASVLLAENLGEPGVYVVGVDKLARDAMRSMGPGDLTGSAIHLSGLDLRRNFVLADDEDRAVWEEAVATAKLPVGPLTSTTFLATEYRAVVLANDITTLEQYTRIARPGRGTRLSRADRIAVWRVVDAYRRGLAMAGKISFAELATATAAALTKRGETLADSVIVDEAQDLHVGHWRLLRAIVAEGPNDLFICEDSHQRIYGEKVVLGRLSIRIQGRSRKLTLNYRTTAQNLRFAVGVLEGADVTDLEDAPESTSDYRSPLHGPPPRLIRATSMGDEYQQIADVLSAWLAEKDVEPSSLAVLVRSGRARDTLQRALAERGVTAQSVTGHHRRPPAAPQLMTMHRAKGLEFRRVVLAGVSESQIPQGRLRADDTDGERADAVQRERLLLYVASSRARDELVVTWHGDVSPFLPVPDGG